MLVSEVFPEYRFPVPSRHKTNLDGTLSVGRMGETPLSSQSMEPGIVGVAQLISTGVQKRGD